jgi:hypothetical protein
MPKGNPANPTWKPKTAIFILTIAARQATPPLFKWGAMMWCANKYQAAKKLWPGMLSLKTIAALITTILPLRLKKRKN